ncbi:MAG TPA: carboxypeptidase-like regulatory domain-containing protein [Candidatus Thermoplasmatota archaeon]|nr:carboxypeptidase-like regulatory domain-containing protein [Candidatus Thermoplasmatota archaeon]
MRRALAALAVLALFLLAGCSKASETPTESVLSVPTSEVKADDATGALAGVVVDQAIRPVAKAAVSVPGQRNMTTDEEGRFVLEALRPGLYFVHVVADGFLTVQTSTEVKAGAATPMRVMLTSDGRPKPSHLTQKFHGHVDMWLGQKTIEDKAPGTLQCTCYFEVVPSGIVRTWVVEARGTVDLENPYDQPNPPLARGSVAWSLASTENPPVGRGSQTNFPFSYHVPGDLFANSTKPYNVKVTGANWPSGQIDYDLFVTTFYIQAPPDGWSFLKGDE